MVFVKQYIYIIYLFMRALICFVLYLTKIILSNICILHCVVLLNRVLFKPCLVRFIIYLYLHLFIRLSIDDNV